MMTSCVFIENVFFFPFQIDHESRAKDWCEVLDEVIRFYYEEKHEV